MLTIWWCPCVDSQWEFADWCRELKPSVLWQPRGVGCEWEVEGRFKREGTYIYIYLWLIYDRNQHNIVIILQLKKKTIGLSGLEGSWNGTCLNLPSSARVPSVAVVSTLAINLNDLSFKSPVVKKTNPFSCFISLQLYKHLCGWDLGLHPGKNSLGGCSVHSGFRTRVLETQYLPHLIELLWWWAPHYPT